MQGLFHLVRGRGKEWTLIRRLGGTMLTILTCAVFAGLVYILAIDIARWAIVGELGAKIATGDMLVAGYVAIAFAPCFLRCSSLSIRAKPLKVQTRISAAVKPRLQSLKR